MHQWTGSALVQVMACHLFGAKPLPEPMLVYWQLDSWEQISVEFEFKKMPLKLSSAKIATILSAIKHGTCIQRCHSIATAQGWGLLSRFPPFCYLPNFSTSPKYMLAIEYHVHILQVSRKLSCGDTCQIWMRFKDCNRYFCKIKNFA